MKPIEVNREELLKIFQSVVPGLSSRGIIEQSNHFILHGDELTTFNDEVSVTVKNPLIGVEGAVPAERLLKILKERTDTTLRVGMKDGSLVFLSKQKGRTKTTTVRVAEKVLLPIGSVTPPDEWKKLPVGFSKAVGTVYSCASLDESQFQLACVRLEPGYLEACDDIQLIRWPMKLKLSEGCSVRRDSIQTVVGMDTKEFSDSKSWIHFKDKSGGVVSCRKWAVAYNDLGYLLEIDGEKMEIPEGFVEALRCASVFVDDIVAIHTIRVMMKEGKIKMRGEGDGGWHEEVMPVGYSGKPISFYASPSLLTTLAKYSSECVVSAEKMKVITDDFEYISTLGVSGIV